MAGSLLYALLRAVLEAVAVARTDRRTLEAEVLALRLWGSLIHPWVGYTALA